MLLQPLKRLFCWVLWLFAVFACFSYCEITDGSYDAGPGTFLADDTAAPEDYSLIAFEESWWSRSPPHPQGPGKGLVGRMPWCFLNLGVLTAAWLVRTRLLVLVVTVVYYCPAVLSWVRAFFSGTNYFGITLYFMRSQQGFTLYRLACLNNLFR